MDAFRTLPIRLTPVAGEALDSWLEGIAYRSHTAFGDVLSAVGLTSTSYQKKGISSWMVQLTEHEAELASIATGVPVAVLNSMTLGHYSERALKIKGHPPGVELGVRVRGPVPTRPRNRSGTR
jgi:TniQ